MTWDWYVWFGWIAFFFIFEGIAIYKNKYDTLSEKFWIVSDKHKWFRVIGFGLCIWGAFHLAFGPCAFGVC